MPGQDTRGGWEAVRLPFRVALDGLWFQATQVATLLKDKFLPFSKGQWQAHGRLAAVYNYDGTAAVNCDNPVLCTGVLARA